MKQSISETKLQLLPPFTFETATAKVQAAEDAWNSKDPETVSLAYTQDTRWRNRTEFINGREQVKDFLEKKWLREIDYKLKKILWSYTEEKIAVKFFYEWKDANNQWFRSYGNELWEFAPNGLMSSREASINDQAIEKHERLLK